MYPSVGLDVDLLGWYGEVKPITSAALGPGPR